MNSSTVRTDPDTFQALLHNSISWEVPEESYALELQLRIVEWLDYAVTQGLQSAIMTEEVGGLLLGRTEAGNCRRTIIDGFTPIPCEHTTGYLYHLTAKDKSVLREQLSRWAPGPGKHLVVVGFYRTHNREGFTLDNEDLALANEFFSDPSHLILLIKPVEARKSIGGIFYQKNGRYIAETTLRFPFSAKLLAERAKSEGNYPDCEVREETLSPISTAALPDAAHPVERQMREQTVVGPPLKSATAEALAPHVLGALPQVADKVTPELKLETARPSPGAGADSHARPIFRYAALERQFRDLGKTATIRLWQGIRNTSQSVGRMHSGRLKWVLSVGFLILVLAAAAYFFRGLFTIGSAAKPAGDVAGLNLKLEKEQNLLYLSWNKESSALRSARAGILSITDGGVDRTLNLDAAQLQSGSVAYYNRTNNLTFRLRVVADGTEASEWVRVTGVRPISGSAGAGRVELKPAARGWGGPGPGKPARGKELSSPMQPLAAADGARSFFPQKGIAMEAISGVTAEKAGGRSARSKLAVNSRNAPPTGGESSKTDPSAPPLPLEVSGNDASATVAPDFAGRTNYVEPRPVRSIEPFVPRSMRKLLPPGSRTKVKVQINEQGKVTRVEPVAAVNADALLTNLALDAARKWRFTPARRDGQKVESELTLEFRFDRDK